MNRSPETPSAPARLRPRFRLQTLLVLVAVICVALGLIVREWQPVYQERKSVAEVQSRGGRVRLADIADVPAPDGVVEGWLRIFLGDDAFMFATHVTVPLELEDDVQILDGFSKLLRLDLSGPGVTDASLARLPHFAELRHLELHHAAINEKGLLALTALPSLRLLSFRNCTLSGLQGLTKMPEQCGLSFTECSLSADHLEDLRGVRGEISVFVSSHDMTEPELLSIRQEVPTLTFRFPGSTSIVGSKRIPENVLPSVQQMPNVTELTFRGPFWSDATVASLKEARNLTHLALDARNLPGPPGSQVSSTTSSESAKLGASPSSDLANGTARGRITDAALEHIRQLDHLTGLSIHGCELTEVGIRHLGQLRSLTSLAIGGVALSDEGIRGLSGLTQLRELHLADTTIEGPGFESLPAELVTLYVYGSKISDEGVVHIASHTMIENLSLRNSRITDEGIRTLAKMPALRHLDLQGTQVTDRSIEVFNLLPLKYLDVMDTQITKAGIQGLKAELIPYVTH